MAVLLLLLLQEALDLRSTAETKQHDRVSPHPGQLAPQQPAFYSTHSQGPTVCLMTHLRGERGILALELLDGLPRQLQVLQVPQLVLPARQPPAQTYTSDARTHAWPAPLYPHPPHPQAMRREERCSER